jgi:hypothetical protein
MKMLGILLVILGAIALVYGGIAYSKDRTVLEIGSLEVTASEKKTFPIPAALGAAVLIGGIALLVIDKRRV